MTLGADFHADVLLGGAGGDDVTAGICGVDVHLTATLDGDSTTAVFTGTICDVDISHTTTDELNPT